MLSIRSSEKTGLLARSKSCGSDPPSIFVLKVVEPVEYFGVKTYSAALVLLIFAVFCPVDYYPAVERICGNVDYIIVIVLAEKNLHISWEIFPGCQDGQHFVQID